MSTTTMTREPYVTDSETAATRRRIAEDTRSEARRALQESMNRRQ
jgi:hypothetical protein